MTDNFDVDGDYNDSINVEGDLKIEIGDTYTQEKPDFFEPSFEKYGASDSETFIKPIVGNFIEVVKNKRLLMLGGAYQYKSEIVRYCSWNLKDFLSHQDIQSEKSPQVLEWYRSADPQSLVTKLQETKESTIFILPDIEPHHINYDIDGILRAIKNRHYVLLTTNKPETEWKVSTTILEDSWREPIASNLYKPGDLAQYLKETLNNDYKDILPDMDISEFQSTSIAEQLKTPEKIDIFIQLPDYP